MHVEPGADKPCAVKTAYCAGADDCVGSVHGERG
jgi:hypothetical protein